LKSITKTGNKNKCNVLCCGNNHCLLLLLPLLVLLFMLLFLFLLLLQLLLLCVASGINCNLIQAIRGRGGSCRQSWAKLKLNCVDPVPGIQYQYPVPGTLGYMYL